MVFVKILLGALAGMLMIAVAIPAVVLVDLASGGTGLGMCPNGLGTCGAGGFAAMELALVLGAAVVVLAFAVTGCVRLLQKLQAPGRSVRL